MVLTGAVGDYGRAIATDTNGDPSQDNTSQLRLDLTHGSFRLDLAALRARITQAFAAFPPNRSTCSGKVSLTGLGTIVDDSGTGAYRGLAGHLRLTVLINEVDAVSSPPCDASTPFAAQTVFVTGSGTVTIT